jgi:hypothetical protein
MSYSSKGRENPALKPSQANPSFGFKKDSGFSILDEASLCISTAHQF